ncbi:MAG: DUF839 domain-containing protein [Gemmatimonadota bacterium]
MDSIAALEPLPASAVCRSPDGEAPPFDLASGFTQSVTFTEEADFRPAAGDGGNHPDQMTLNETGPDAGRFLYRTHETEENSAVTVTDLVTGLTTVAAQAFRYEALDGIVWTPWGSLLFAEEVVVQRFPEPGVEHALRGLVHELDPSTGIVGARPALGSRSHEGMAFGSDGALYGLSESRGVSRRGQPGQSGAILRFVPDVPGNLSAGRLYALRVLDSATRLGDAEWIELERAASEIDSDAEAVRVGATGWERPEDIERWTLGNGNDVLFVSITDEHLVLRIELDGERASVSEFIRAGLNAPAAGDPSFEFPDNLALDAQGRLYVVEDNGPGDLWWVDGTPADQTAKGLKLLASLADCAAEPTGIYHDRWRDVLRVHVQHAGGRGNDLEVVIARSTP